MSDCPQQYTNELERMRMCEMGGQKRHKNIINMVFIKLLIFVHAVFQAVSQDCAVAISAGGPLDNSIPQFESGFVTLTYPGKPTRQNYYNVTYRNTTITKLPGNIYKPLQLATTISLIDSFLAIDVLDFSVRATSYATYCTIIFIIEEKANWAQVLIHYIATSRSDFRVGTIVASNPELLVPELGNGTKQIKVQQFLGLTRKLVDNISIITPVTFLTGIRCRQRFVEATIVQTSLGIKQNILNVTVNLIFQRQPIELLYITYVIYPNSSLEWRNLNFGDLVAGYASKFNLTSTPSPTTNEINFVGMNRVNAKSAGLGTGRTTLTTGKRILATIIAIDQIRQFFVNYEVKALTFEYAPLGLRSVPPIGNGTGTGGNSSQTPPAEKCYTLQSCVSAGGQFVLTKSGGVRCALCRQFARFSYEADRCVCMPEFYDDNGTCRNLSSLCQLGEIYLNGACYKQTQKIIGGSCQVSQLYNPTLGRCICRPEYTAYKNSAGINKCAQACTGNLEFQISAQRCICRSNQFDSSGSCLKCEAVSSYYDTRTRRCECSAGYARVGDTCFKCSDNAKYDAVSKTCKCNAGYIGLGTICRKVQTRITENFTIVFSDSKPN